MTLPVGSVPPGSRTLTLQYAGDDSHAASSTSVPVEVSKGVPTLTVKASSRVRVGQQALVRATLTGPGGVPVTGTVQVRVGGRTLTGTVRDGSVSFRLPRATRVGTLRVAVSYRGSSTLAPVAKSATIRVVR